MVLKVCEGVFEFVMKMAGQGVARRPRHREAAQASRRCRTWSSATITASIGGAPLLGIDGICIICHGSSGDRAIKNALGVAARYARARLNELIVQELENSGPSDGRQLM